MRNAPVLKHFFEEDPFTLKEESLKLLQKKLKTFHKSIDFAPCQGVNLEGLIVKAMRDPNELEHLVKWKANARGDTDITLADLEDFIDFYISVKSGTVKKDILRLSGFRLTRFNKSLNAINDYLKNHKQDLTISIASEQYTEGWEYSVRYIDENLFKYPESGAEWKETIGVKGDSKGKLVGYHYQMDNGIKCVIHTSASWQLWWNIPLDVMPDAIIIES